MVYDASSEFAVDEDVRRRFEAAWSAGQPQALDTYLPDRDDPRYLGTLEELVHIDLEFLWKKARTASAERTAIQLPLVESYLARFPPLNQPAIVVRLLQQEYRVRHLYGDHPDSGEYRRRFPGLDSIGTGIQTIKPEERTAVEEVPAIPGYEILGVLGQGGMGVVFKARQVALNRIVALKMIQGGRAGAEDLARFRVEAEAIAQLQHPNIVQIYEIGEWRAGDGSPPMPFFSLEFAGGGSLAQATNGNPQDPAIAASLTEMLARAIHAAHLQGVIHRDLKPANILLSGEWSVVSDKFKPLATDHSTLNTLVPKITDFGLAKRLQEDHGQTQTGQIMGTPSYMSPEQAMGKGHEIGPATDVYALGALLYELLTGRPPFKAATVLDTLEQVRSVEAVPPAYLQPKLPRDLETICLKCLEKEPRRRYATALDLAEDLRRQQAGEPIQARPVSRVERVHKWAKRRPAATTALALAVLLVLSVGGLSGWHYVDVRDKLDQRTAEVHKLNEDRSLQGLRDNLEHLEAEKRHAIDREDWPAAREMIDRMLALLKESPQALADQQAQVHGESLALKNARARFDKFVQSRDEVLFHDTLLTGFKKEIDTAKTRRAAEAALHLYGIKLGASVAPAIPIDFLGKSEQAAIREGVYQTFFVLAEVLAKEQRDEKEARFRAALAALDRAEQVLPATRALHLRRARYLHEVKDFAAARRERARADAPMANAPTATAFDHFLVGEDWYKQDNLAEAIRSFDAALQLQPNHYWAHYFLSACYLKQHPRPRYDLAKSHLTACLAQGQDVAWVYLLRGFTHTELGEFDLAAADYATALRKNPTEEARYGIHANRGVLRIRQALAVAPAANLWGIGTLVAQPAPALTVAALAQGYQQQRLAEAMTELDAAIALAPDPPQPYLAKAQAYQVQGKLLQAVAELDRALTAGQKLPALFRERAKLHYLREDWAAALRDFKLAMAGERTLGDKSTLLAIDHVEIGRMLFQLANYDEAVKHCEAALALRPDYAAAQRWRAEALLKLGRYREAVDALERYEKNGRLVPEIYVVRGLAHEKLGEHAAALADFTEALRFGPDAAVRSHRGWVYLLAFDAPRLALADFEEALKLGSQGGEPFCGRGYARVQVGDWRSGVEDAEEALKRGPLTPRLLYNAARIFAQASGKMDLGGISSARTQEEKLRFQRRALQLIHATLDRLPSASRQAFWANIIQRDAALASIAGTSEFAQLAAELMKH